jgi:hypothetical protein
MNARDWRELLSDVDEKYIEQAVLWCQDIVNCLVRYAGRTREEAEQLVSSSYIPQFLNEDVNYVFHEIPYYWAMVLLYGRSNLQWYKDKKLWPPPDDYSIPWPSK